MAKHGATGLDSPQRLNAVRRHAVNNRWGSGRGGGSSMAALDSVELSHGTQFP